MMRGDERFYIMSFKSINGWHIIYNFFGIKIKKRYTPNLCNKLNLIYDTDEGIGNRVFGLIDYVNCTKPKQVNIYWDNSGWVTAKFKELFEYTSDFELNEYNNKEIIKGWKNKWKGDNTEITVYQPPVHMANNEGRELSYKDITEEEFEKYSTEFKKLKPSQNVRERINSINLPDKFTALQVRNAKDWDEYGREESMSKFFEQIDKYPSDTKFYLSAMNNEVSNEIKQKYGDRILELPDKNYKSMIDAVADLFIMSYAERAIYSYGSTFGELAFWLSEKYQKITIVGNDSGWIK